MSLENELNFYKKMRLDFIIDSKYGTIIFINRLKGKI